MVFLGLLALTLIPAIIGVVFFNGITWKEFAAHLAIQVAVCGASAGIIYYRDTTDTEILNGVVTSKKQIRVNCEHSYSCHCRQKCTKSGKTESCHEVCDTCYEHFNDFDWKVYGSVGSWVIGRVDRQGVTTPSRWAQVKIGEPTSETHSYANYVKAAPNSLFRHQGLMDKYQESLPTYPLNVYNYWHLDSRPVDNLSVLS